MQKKSQNLPKTGNKITKNGQKTAKNADNLSLKNDISSEKGEFLNISELARRLEKDRETVRNAILEADLEPRGKDKNSALYDFEEVAALFEGGEEKAAKLRKLRAEADLKELELAKQRGEFASKAEFIEIVQRLFSSLHKKIAVQQPAKLANKLFKADSPNEIARILSDDSKKIFNALRTDFTDFL
jgi:hypothetical protein